MPIANNAVNAVAATILPDSPFDAVTGLQVPTIAAFTAGGISVISDAGTVFNSASTTAFTKGSIDADEVIGVNGTGALVSAKPRALTAGFALTSYLPTTAPGLMGVPTVVAGGKQSRVMGNASGVTVLRENFGSRGKDLSARISSAFNSGFMAGDARRCYLADTDAGSVGPVTELVTNGDFSGGATGWTPAPSVSVVGGAAVCDGVTSSANGAVIVQASTNTAHTIGKTYALTFTLSGSGSESYSLNAAGVTGAIRAAPGTYTEYVVATAASYPITIMQRASSGTRSGTIDNISVKEVVADRSYKAAGANIYGTLTKAQVGVGSQLVAYSGFSAANYIQEPYSADLDVGTGELSFGGWFNTATAAASVLVDRSAATGPYYRLGMDGAGKMVATVSDGTTTRTVTTTAAYNTGTYNKVRATYNGAGTLGITVNGNPVASTTGAPLLTLNNPNAVLTIGNSRTLDAPFPGSISLLKIGATVPTSDQAKWMYEQEKQMFRDGAQITLPSSNAVLDLTYDESQDKWVAVQATHESTFTGLVRTAVATPSAGSFSKIEAKSGIELVSRTTTSPGVDVTIPAYGLREQLVRRAEDAAKQRKTLTTFDFDGIAAQTDFVLQPGWTAVEVVSNGVTQREGSTKAFTRLFDGFRETIRFAVAPGAASWIRINARKE